jgi:hypothetical protein
MPNRQVKPMETWQAKVPTIVGKGPTQKVLDIELICTYEGLRMADNRNEAVISLVGAIKGRDKKKDREALGQVVGRATLDLDAGYLSGINMKLSSEVEFDGGVQVVLSEDIVLTRVTGNTRDIVAFVAKKDPEPKPKDPEPKPKIDPPGPKLPKLVFEINSQLGKDDLLGGPKGRRSKTHEVKLEEGTTYVIEMKKMGVSKVDPYVQLLDSAGKVVAFDDNSGENMNAKITYTATQSGMYKVVATSVNLGIQTGAYHLTVTAVPPKAKE